MASERTLYKNGLWFFAVMLGLAIRQSLADVVPHVFDPPAHDMKAVLAEVFRLIVFLIVSVRFFLGTVLYFERAYGDPEADERYKRKSLGLDFLFGFLHYVLFFAWAMSIDLHKYQKHWFPVLMALILSYDIPWLIALRNMSTRRLVEMWARINTLTLLLSGLFYTVVRTTVKDVIWAEDAAFICVLFFSTVDMAEMVSGKEIIRRKVERFLAS